MEFIISLIFNMAAIAPSLTWPLLIPYMADYFIADVSGTSTEL
jgi:MFS family permease